MNIAIAGYGAEGKANYRYFSTRGHTVTIVDERASSSEMPDDADHLLGEGVFNDLNDYDLVVRTAGLAPHRITTNSKIWSATNEFFANCPAPIIGVTGTKGKGTTASLIASILKKAGRTVHLVGNIGTPALDVLDYVAAEDIVVYELSSFQLWDIEQSPHIAVVLMIEQDHMDVHANMDEYVAAKRNIVKWQSSADVVVYNQENSHSVAIAMSSAAERIAVPSDEFVSVAWDSFWYGDQEICPTSTLKLAGAHNLDNACAAIAAVWNYTQNTKAIAAGLAAFDGLPHRLKHVRNVRNISYYDDSIATTPGSAIAAIRAFEAPKVLILGGSHKGASFDELARVASSGNVRAAILIGEEAPRLKRSFETYAPDVTLHELGRNTTMKQIVEAARDAAQKGDVVVMSPACASFGMFENYADRGAQFVAAVRAL